jgi:hypothetical protein
VLGERLFAAATAALLALALAGCGSPPSGGAADEEASAQLAHVPGGTADVEYDAATRTLTVAVHVTGVMPGMVLAPRIRQGDCGAGSGDVIDALTLTAADSHGVVEATARVVGIEAVPMTAALEFAPATAPSAAPLFCGDLNGQTGMVHLVPAGGPSGTASLDLDPATRTLTVRLVVQGLVPNSTHPTHIHQGSCAVQGPMAFPLPVLQADAHGRATLHATVSGVTRLGRWYVNVHRGPDMKGGGAAPVSCGDVTPA